MGGGVGERVDDDLGGAAALDDDVGAGGERRDRVGVVPGAEIDHQSRFRAVGRPVRDAIPNATAPMTVNIGMKKSLDRNRSARALARRCMA